MKKMIKIFIGALIFSIWYVTLFFGKNIGLSMLLFAVPITLFIINILEKNEKQINKKAKILVIPITLLASTYFIFNNEFFNAINILVIPLLVIIMILGLFSECFKFNTDLAIKILEIIFIPLSYVKETFGELIEILKEKLKIRIDSNGNKKIKKVIKSILITLPIVIIIIMLLSSADEIFENVFKEIFTNITYAISKIKISTVIIKFILILGIFTYLLSFFNYLITKTKRQEEISEENITTKDNFTIKMILGALNIIYLIFSITQIQTLYMINDSMNYSYYARQGFFQLMAVSIINLVTILIAKKSENKTENKNEKYTNGMCLLMIGFTFIILISAVIRMYFYENAFGYTLLRLLVYCSLFTEAVLLVPTILYVIGKKVNLLKTYFTVILTIYVCMNFANFDNIIAKRNVNRYIETGKIDMEYLENNTDTDAIKQIIKILDTDKTLKEENKFSKNDKVLSTDKEENERHIEVRDYLQDLYNELEQEDMDFRDLNLSKIYAKKLIKNSNVFLTNYEDDSEIDIKDNILVTLWNRL